MLESSSRAHSVLGGKWGKRGLSVELIASVTGGDKNQREGEVLVLRMLRELKMPRTFQMLRKR